MNDRLTFCLSRDIDNLIQFIIYHNQICEDYKVTLRRYFNYVYNYVYNYLLVMYNQPALTVEQFYLLLEYLEIDITEIDWSNYLSESYV